MNQEPQNMDHLNETMLYKKPGPHEIHGGYFDYVIVPEADIEEAQSQGWHLTTEEARAAHEAAISAPPPPLPVAVADLESVPPPVETAPPAPQPAQESVPRELDAPATYDELKAKAKELGLEYPGNISKAALLAMITAKLAEQV